jgi:nucleoid DNA-binding protein
MKQQEFIKELASRLNLSQVETKKLWMLSTKIMGEQLDQDHSIRIPSFGGFQTKQTKRRKAYSPFHKSFFIYPPKRSIAFKASRALKKELNTK